jgi:hypothetical protein
MKALEWAGVLTWQNRITRIQVRERDLFGHWASRWRVIRTSNAYVFRDPQQRPQGVPASKSENQIGTQNQELLILLWHQHVILTAPWSAPCGSWAAPSQEDCSRMEAAGWSLPSDRHRIGNSPCRDRSTGGSRAGAVAHPGRALVCRTFQPAKSSG